MNDMQINIFQVFNFLDFFDQVMHEKTPQKHKKLVNEISLNSYLKSYLLC